MHSIDHSVGGPCDLFVLFTHYYAGLHFVQTGWGAFSLAAGVEWCFKGEAASERFRTQAMEIS